MKTATYLINGTSYEVNVNHPEDIFASIGKERANALLLSFGCAHWVQSAIKRSFAVMADSESTEAAKKKASVLVDKVKSNAVLEFMDFVPGERGNAVSEQDEKNAAVFLTEYEKGTFSKPQVEQAYAKLGLRFDDTLSDDDMVAAHAKYLLAKRKATKSSVL